MILQNNLRKNSLYLFLARASAQLLALLFTAIIARKLSIEDFGHFAFIASMIYIGNTFTNFGTDTLLIRETSRANKITQLATQALTLQILFSLMYCVTMLALRDTSLFIYSLALFPLTVFSVNNALLRAFGRMDIFSFLSFGNGVMQVVVALLTKDILHLCFYLLIGQFLLSIISFLICRASLPDFNLFPLSDFSPIFKLTLPFASLTILLVLIQRLGIILVSTLLDETATGFFSSIVRVVEGLKLGHYAILGALLPILSRGGENAKQSFRKAFLFLMIASFCFVIALLIFARPIMYILYGNNFAQMPPQLSLLAWSLLPYTVSSFISYALIANGHESTIAKSAFFSLIVYFFLYILLIPIYGITGAVWSTLIGEFLQMIIFIMFYIRRDKGISK